jgi:hypothetical protein
LKTKRKPNSPPLGPSILTDASTTLSCHPHNDVAAS